MRRSSASTTATREVSRRTNIHECPYVQTNVRWPVPVDQRLNELLWVLSGAGTDTTRSQLVAALVSAAPAEAEGLADLLRKYAEQTAGTVVLQSRGPIEMGERHPGRRPRR